MARRFAKVSEEEIVAINKKAFFIRVSEERWIHTSTLRVSVYIHHYSPPLRGIVVYYLKSYVKHATKMKASATITKIYSSRIFCPIGGVYRHRGRHPNRASTRV